MKLGLGLDDGLGTAGTLRFAKQVSATPIVAHLLKKEHPS
jgi:hypothetical protein